MVTWDDFCEAVLTTSTCRTTTDQALDAFETRIGILLPNRYREFALTFGAGDLTPPEASGDPSFQISIPGRFDRPMPHHYDIVKWEQESQNDSSVGTATPVRRRLVVFAKDDLGNLYGWAPDEVTCPDSRDYAVYKRDVDGGGDQRVASTFEEFLVAYCVGSHVAVWKKAGGRLDREIPNAEDREEESEEECEEESEEECEEESEEECEEESDEEWEEESEEEWEEESEEEWEEEPEEELEEESEEEREKESRIRFYPNFTVSDSDQSEDKEDGDHDEDGEELVEVIHRLLTAPERYGDEGENLLWREYLPDGEAKVKIWIPRGEADRNRMEQFWAACEAIDWDGEQIHEVVSFGIKSRRFTMADITEALDRARTLASSAAPKTGPPPEFTAEGLIRRVPHPAAPVAESWRRIEAWLAAHCPEVFVALLPGASDWAIDRFEKAIGQELPADVRESYKIHDGLGRIPLEFEEAVRGDDDESPESELIRDLFYGYGLDAIDDGAGAKSILTSWNIWTEFADSEHEEDDKADQFEVFPAGAIQLRYACRGWIPLYNSHLNCLGVDLDPGPNGVRGQVINFGRDEEHKYVLATSWAQFLEDFADELEAGNYDIEHREGFEREFQMKRPKLGPLFWNYQSWAEAKLAPLFQAVQAPPPAVLSPVDPETARECRAVVEGFIAEQHAWEVRWLAVRPVKDLGFVSIGETSDGRFVGDFTSPADRIEQGLPVPETLVFANSKAFSDTVKQARWLKSQLGFGRYYTAAMAERRAIYTRYTTAWAQSMQGDTFWLQQTPKFDPHAHIPIEVLRRDAATVFVVLAPRHRSVERFLLKQEEGAWRIETLQGSFDGGPFSNRNGLYPASI